MKRLLVCILLAALCLPLGACNGKNRHNMVRDEKDGLLYGSFNTHNLVVDPDQFDNSKLKVSIRNTSGDRHFNLSGLKSQIENAYAARGYEIVQGKGWGLKIDINVRYSGHIEQNYAREYASIGAGAGAVGGYYDNDWQGAAAGTVAGASLGYILGSYDTFDTYMILTDVVFYSLRKNSGVSEYSITFSGAKPRQRTFDSGYRRPHKTGQTTVAAYAGGRNVDQIEIVGGVRDRLRRILSNII